jgi:Gluconate 2-dehydrogenase subunit 3
MARRQRYQRVLLPGEKEGRRGFLKKGLVGAVILAVGGGTWLVTRRTRPAPDLGGPLRALSPEEATVVLAIADRLVPERAGFPRPLEAGVPRKVDAMVAVAHPATQKEVRQLLRLFENALTGLVLEGQFRPFTACPPREQDARLRSWARSRIALRRSGFQALKRLVYAAYFGSPETWEAIGYPGPPPLPPPVVHEPLPPAPDEEEKGRAAEKRPPARPVQPARAPGTVEAAAPRPVEPAPPRPISRPPAPLPVEPELAPRGGMPLPEEDTPP